MTRRGLFGSIAALLAARKLPAPKVVPANETKNAAVFMERSRDWSAIPASEWCRSIEIPRELFDDFTYSFKGPS